MTGLLLLQVPREARLTLWLAGCSAQLPVAVMVHSVTLLGVEMPSTVGFNI